MIEQWMGYPITVSLLVVFAWIVSNAILKFADIKYGGAKKIDSLEQELGEVKKHLKKFDDEKLIEKVRNLDNRFGRL